MALMEVQFYSHVMQLEMSACVIIPMKGSMERGSMKTLWLYHGGSGDEIAWLRETFIERFANERNIAVVMPTVHRSCFIDMNIGGPYGTYVGRELPEIMRRMFPVLSAKREDNFISGFSNGGYGCYNVGLKYPETYGAIGAFAAGDKADCDFTVRQQEKSILFGPGDMEQNEYGCKYLAKKLIAEGKPAPRIYHGVGEFDAYKWMNDIMCDFFKSFPGDPFDYVYDVAPGLKHEWDMCNLEIQKFFDYLGLPKNQ